MHQIKLHISLITFTKGKCITIKITYYVSLNKFFVLVDKSSLQTNIWQSFLLFSFIIMFQTLNLSGLALDYINTYGEPL